MPYGTCKFTAILPNASQLYLQVARSFHELCFSLCSSIVRTPSTAIGLNSKWSLISFLFAIDFT